MRKDQPKKRKLCQYHAYENHSWHLLKANFGAKPSPTFLNKKTILSVSGKENRKYLKRIDL